MKRVLMLLGVILAIGGIVGFVFSTELKNLSRIDGTPQSGGVGSFVHRFDIEPDTYRVSFWIDAEQGESMPGFPTAAGSVEIQFDGDSLTSETLVASSGEARGGVKRATVGIEKDLTIEAPGELVVTGELREGDGWDLEIYRNVSSMVDIAPGICIIIAICGVFIALKNRGD